MVILIIHAQISLIRKIGWRNKISLKRGIKNVIKDLRFFDENNALLTGKKTQLLR